MTIQELLGSSKDQGGKGEIPYLERSVLLGHLLNLDSTGLIVRSNDTLCSETIAEYQALLAKRIQGIPVAYLTNQREFWSLSFYVDERVLIPRHETETLVERVLHHAGKLKEPKILELGTGSGAIALALASELPDASIVATDQSEEALEVARKNHEQLTFGNVDFLSSDWFSELGVESFDFICSNPPYIREGDTHLNEGDVRFEPREALVAGDDGLREIREIVEDARNYLSSGGSLMLEHGFDQGDLVRQLFDSAGFVDVETTRDLSGNDRVTEGRLGS